MNIRNTNYTISSNKLLAAIWFLLSALIALSSVAAFLSARLFMVVSMLLLAVMLFLVGCQRTDKLRITSQKFNLLMRNIAVAVVFASALSILLASENA